VGCNGKDRSWASVNSEPTTDKCTLQQPRADTRALQKHCTDWLQCTAKSRVRGGERGEQGQTMRLLGEICHIEKVTHRKPCSCDVKAAKIMLMTALLLSYCQGLVRCADASLWWCSAILFCNKSLHSRLQTQLVKFVNGHKTNISTYV